MFFHPSFSVSCSLSKLAIMAILTIYFINCRFLVTRILILNIGLNEVFNVKSVVYCQSHCCCSWVLQCSLTSQVISVTFYIEHEKSEKFCSEALTSAWYSSICHKFKTRDQRLYFPFDGSRTQDFSLWRKYIDLGRVWTREPWIQWRVW